MKALPAPPQLELLPRRRDLALTVVERSERDEIVRALAEVLLAAAEAVPRKEDADEAH